MYRIYRELIKTRSTPQYAGSHAVGAVVWSGDYESDKELVRDAIRNGVSLLGVDMSEMDLSGLSFHGCDLTNVDLFHAELEGTDLQSAILDGTNLEAVNLRGAILRRASLMGANLADADLRGAQLLGADLRTTNTAGVRGVMRVELLGHPALAYRVAGEVRLDWGWVTGKTVSEWLVNAEEFAKELLEDDYSPDALNVVRTLLTLVMMWEKTVEW